MAPALIVLMGNFMSRPFGQSECSSGVCVGSLVALPSCHLRTPFSPLPAKDDRATFTRLMQDLADLIASYPGLAAGSHFVLVPGPNDPGASSALPQTRVRHWRVECVEVAAGTWLTSLVCVYVCGCIRFPRSSPKPWRSMSPPSRSQPTLAGTHIAAHHTCFLCLVIVLTMPTHLCLCVYVFFCRVRFFNKEIVLFRQDLMAKMRRQSLLPITEADHAPHEHVGVAAACVCSHAPFMGAGVPPVHCSPLRPIAPVDAHGV